MEVHGESYIEKRSHHLNTNAFELPHCKERMALNSNCTQGNLSTQLVVVVVLVNGEVVEKVVDEWHNNNTTFLL